MKLQRAESKEGEEEEEEEKEIEKESENDTEKEINVPGGFINLSYCFGPAETLSW